MLITCTFCFLALFATVAMCVRGTVRAERYYIIRSMRRRRDRMERRREWRRRTRPWFTMPSAN